MTLVGGARPRDATDDHPPTKDALSLITAYLIALLAVPAPMVFSSFGQVGGPATLLAVGLFLGWLWAVVQHLGMSALPSSRMRVAALAYLVAMVATYAHSNALPLPVDERSPADSALIRTIGCVGVALLICDGLGARERLWQLVERISIGLGLLALLALVQVTTRQPIIDRLSYPLLTSSEEVTLEQRGALVRPFGTATHPIEFAAVLAIALPLALAAAGRPGRRQRLHLAIAVVVSVVVMITGSRTAIVCATVAIVAMLPAWRPLVRWIVAGVGAVMVSALFVLIPGFIGTIRGLFSGAADDPSIASRTNSYAIAEAFVREQPLFGRGMGTVLPKYWIFDNQWIGLAIGAGAVGIVALLTLIWSAAVDAGRAARRDVLDADRQLDIAGRAGVLTGAVALATFDAFSFTQAAGMFFVLIGICGAARTLPGSSSGSVVGGGDLDGQLLLTDSDDLGTGSTDQERAAEGDAAPRA